MGLGEIPIDAISRRKAGRQLRQAAFHDENPINAFDTETRSDGRVYLLTRVYDQIDDYEKAIGNSDFSPLNADQVFNALVSNQTRQPAVNVWYNLDFDVNALIGTVLDESHMIELADTNMTTFESNGIEYEMTYINNKFLSIKDENRHTSTHFDISQFFLSSLDQAARSWLGKEKDDIDPTRADEYDWQTVVGYAIKDAEITQELWKRFVGLGEGQLNIPLGKPISTGYIAQNVVFDTLLQKPKWGSSRFQDMARKAYHGGRFEVYRRGFFDDVIGLDINSAYPYHMAQIPDLGSCDINVFGGTIEDIRQADWGFVTATVTTDASRNIQPFAIKTKQVRYPALDKKRITVTADEFLFAVSNDYLTDFTIHQTGLVYEKPNPTRPFAFLAEWYEDRKRHKELYNETENPRHDKFQFILKVIMNSVYGKTCQVTEKHEYLPTDEDFTPGKTEFVTEGYEGDMIKGWYEGGDLFNPFYASYITANTRLQLHKKALELGIEDSTIMFATDCLMLDASDVTDRQIRRMIDPDSLGKWDYEYDGSAFVVGSGVYDVMADGKLIKMAKRGFREVTKTYDSWRQAASANETNGAIQLTNERPARFKEWLLHEGHPRPAEFFIDQRELRPDFDSKRRWHESPTFASLLASNHGSRPLIESV